ncbi:MAG: GDP-fucose synthetase [Microgenomates group bacterium GW2011_GWC1_44_37]|uniref:GDP-L-fucose synthase n=1 Tax=Candidatus Collierbacteria bacterium GW2011_GWB2_44_22 TaxID=1618387 RepID=A0A0G1HZ94_9BACT|nr:MAG: GDP-fucose synthetase [Candidatus Collierbacteria bacterium GW2011_GWA2_44_13]KKT52481.1 MAG: GDP-fucose synthetase [Candidatus Collierbacteria bacterium GW2011_GWB2_44_22]KKT62704.1 MAG: GDP-fucose synthetase [Candidatus Collierbacteria bacterium GW2011_GWD1_44_27]KKT66482.1 MAG: GDP-fucose synthetase [Candidatus Collierbacteria bacterium GW2011_GWC2_44_30]KKT69184.1 MAG: GDP-fucose synthetase [Microgenomates group bacterium GW2011_GWC1_44_37]KKT89144.1 MAG: GDP-fucose synthetase [Can
MKKDAKIFVAGGQSGLVGTAIVRALMKNGYTNIITRKRSELDLESSVQVEKFFEKEKPEYVFLAAALVGGIMANKTRKADFIYDNLQIQNNVIHASWKNKVKKLMFLGSSCIYPKLAKQPIKESYLLTGSLEETNDAYAISKIAGIKMCQSYNEQYGTNFISVMPTNLYGPHDNFDLNSSHVLPALIRKFHDAKIGNKKEVVLWGTGNVYREFLYVDDMADACVYLMEHYDSSEIINIGTGVDLKIKELAQIIKKIVGFKGKIVWDSTKPDGTPKKLLDVSRLLSLGWKPQMELEKGIGIEYDWFINNFKN